MNMHHDNPVTLAVLLAMIPLACGGAEPPEVPPISLGRGTADASVVGPAASVPEKEPPMLVGWEGPSFVFMRDTMMECISHADIEIACPSRFLKKHVVGRPGVRRDPHVWVNNDDIEKITLCCPDTSGLVGVTARDASVDGGAPEQCAQTGIAECDALVALSDDPRYQRGEKGASKAIFTCDMWKEAIALNGYEKIRTGCMESIELLKLLSRLPKASSSSSRPLVVGTSLLPSGARPSTLTSPKTPPVIVPGDPDPAEVQ